METASSVAWIFKPDSTTPQVSPNHPYQHASPGSLNKSPLKSVYTHSPAAYQPHTSLLTPRSGSISHVGSPYRAGSASPLSSSGRQAQSTPLSQDLLLPMMPSTEDSKLHATVSGLRFALQDSQLQLSHSQQQVEALQQRCTASDAQAAQLQQQLTELQGDTALLGAKLHDGSLDMVKGQLIQQQLAESSQAAEAAAGHSQQAALQIQSLQDQLRLQQQAQASERERLSMEAAQSRLLCKARARQVSSLELQCKAETTRAEAAAAEAQQAREEAARSISDSMLQQDAAMKQGQQAREAASEAHHQLQQAQQTQAAAEQQRQQAEDCLRDVRLHMDWQDSRIADLESQDLAQTARRYDSELQSMKQQLQQERQRLEAQLQQERRAREAAEAQLHNAVHSSKGAGPHSGNLGSPRKGRENSSPNKLRGSSSLQESVVLKAQLQQAQDAAERDSAHWRAALEEEQRVCEKLRQQLNQLEESDQLVATAAANSQQQVHHLRQQLESEKSRAAMLDANLQAAAHSVRTSKQFKRQRQRARYTVQDSARMDDGHADRSWQHALGLTDNDTSSSAEEDDEESDHLDLTGQPPGPGTVTVGLQTDDVALTALLAGTAGKDSLMSAARQEILRLKDVNSRLLEQASPGLGRGAVVAEKEAEAAVTAAKAAAHQQQEHALQRCNAEWTDRLDALRLSLQEAKAEAQRVRDCQAELMRQHQTELHQVKSASEQQAAALQADLSVLQQRIAAAEAELEAAQKRVQQLEQQLQIQQAEAAATEKQMAVRMEQAKMDADTDLAMLMLESSSSASEAASRLAALKASAEASEQAATAELQQQLDAERQQRRQLQQQLQAVTAEVATPPVTDTVLSAEAASAANSDPESEVQTAAEETAGPVVLAAVSPDASQGAPASGDALPPSSTEAPSSGQEAASPAQAAKHVGVQTDLLLMHLPTPDAASATAGDQTEARNNASPVPAVLEGKQHLQAAGGKHQTTDASCGPDSCDSPHRRAAAGDASRGPESCASPCDRPAAADASCGPESYDSPGDVLGAADVADSSPQQQQAPSMHSSSGHRSNTQNAMRNSKAASANSDDDATQAQPGRDPAAMRRSQQGPEEVDGQRRVDVARQGGQPTGGQLLESRGKAKGEGEAEWSRGLQLPQKLSIASLARHAGVDRAFMQEWVASVRVPSEEATALSRMADAAAAAAAFTADGMKTHGHGTLTQQAQRAELAKRAQQASDAVLRGDSDAASLQEIDSRSYSRWSGVYAGEDDMCRTSSAVATPESSNATARAAPVSLSHRSVSSGHSSRKGHLPPVYTTSPIITHHRLHQSSAIHSAASPIATALPFSSGQLSPAQADTPRFATLGMLGSSSQRRSMLGGSTSHAYGQPSRLQGDESVPPAQARMSSSYSQNLPESPGQLPPNSMTSSFRSPVGPGVAQHACRDAQSASYAQFRSRDSVYPQHGLTGSPAQRARPSSPYHGAVSGSSPLRSPAHAAAVSAVEQQLHASLHEQQGHPQHRPAPTSPSALPGSHQHKEHSQDRLDSAIAYQPWRGHARSLNAPQHSGQDLHDMPHSLSQASQLSQVPQDSHSLLRPSSQYLGHASPELDSLSQRLRDQKVAMDRHGRFGISPLQSRAAGHSPGQERLTAGAVPRSTGAGSTYTHSALPERSPSRLGGTLASRSDASRSWMQPPQPQATSHMPLGQGRPWSGLRADDVSSDLQASMYHKERSRLQEALARQRAMSAVSSSQVPADPVDRVASPWDSAWDQQSAALRAPRNGHPRQFEGQRQRNQGAFGSIVSDYRPVARHSPMQNASVGAPRGHRYEL